MKKISLLSIVLFASLFVGAQIINVPSSVETIQAGIDSAVNGDTILVAEGTYFENLNFNGKSIVLASHFIIDGDTNHISNTIIDGSQPVDPDFGSVVTLNSGEDTSSVLTGFTITGGTGTLIQGGGWDLKAGGGILLDGAGCKITHNYIEYNELKYTEYVTGGGISSGGADPIQPWLILDQNKIRYNKAISTTFEANGGGIESYCNLIMTNNYVTNNEANGAYQALGAGVSLWGAFGHIELLVTNNVIAHNKLISNSDITNFAQAGGVSVREDCEGTIANNTVIYNEIEVPDGKNCYGPGFMTWYAKDELTVENNIITQNFHTGGSCFGGGFSIWFGAGTYQNNVIQNNSATHGAGIAIMHSQDGMVPSIINNTVTLNTGADYGGGLYVDLADAIVMNSVFWDNDSGLVDCFYVESGDLEVRYSNIQGDELWSGEGNLNVDPEFKADGYHLDFSSLMVNSGTDSIEINGIYYYAPKFDIDMDERPFDGTFPDIGADEALWCCVAIEEQARTNNQVSVQPNPFISSTMIEFELQSASFVELRIFNQLGHQVEVLANETKTEGKHFIVWNGESRPAGLYLGVLKTNMGIAKLKLIKH